jgi:hypothetical protein
MAVQRIVLTCLAVLLAAVALAVAPGWSGPQVEAWIEVERRESRVLLVPVCRSAQDLWLEYRLVVSREGPAGASRSRQAGKVEAAAGQKMELCRATVTLGKNDACRAELTILRDGVEVAAKAVSLRGGAAGGLV